MSIKIRVSYNTEEEFAGVIQLLSPMLKNVKVQPQKGRYKRAYISLRNSKVEYQNDVKVNRRGGLTFVNV